jgi:hypothetical protein
MNLLNAILNESLDLLGSGCAAARQGRRHWQGCSRPNVGIRSLCGLDLSASRCQEHTAAKAQHNKVDRSANLAGGHITVVETWNNSEEIRWAARHWATKMGLEIAGIRVQPMTRKWDGAP